MKNLNNLKNIEYNCEITKLVKLWENTFKHEISPEEDFYAIGGNSLIMMRLIKKIEETFNLKISPMKFIELSNIINIAKYIVENGDNLNKEKNFPLSSIQEAYYIGRNSEYEMGGVSTHVYFEVKTEFDIEKLTNSLNILIDKQPSLRTIFIDEHKQKVMDTVEKYCIEYEDCSDVSEEIIQHRINNIRDELSKTVLSPNTWPLFKIKALKNVQGKTILFINIDLLIMDGASIGLFMRQWRDICEDKDIKNVKFDFFKYRNQEKDDKNTKEYFDDKKYWKNISPEIPEKPNLNLKDKTKNIKNFNSKRVSKEISLDLFNKIYIQASKRNVSISVALCTAYAYILGYWSNQNNLSINVTTMNRPVYDGIEEVIGEFTKNLILDASLSIDNSFWGNCYSIQTRLLRGLSHQNYDGVEFIRELSKERNLYDGGVMPIVFTSMLFSERQNNINALGEILYSISQTSQVYLDLQISYSSDGVLINWDYVEELFDESMINQMFNQYISLVESLAGENIAYPDLSVHDSNLVKTYNETKEEIPSTTVQDEFKKIVEKYPDKVMVKDKDGSITCKELDEKSAQICNFLIEKGIKQGDIVAVLGERKKETIINILGILKSGAAYVAIDPEHPLERQKYILENSRSKLYIDRDFYGKNKVSSYSAINPQIEYDPKGLAYIIYTSGSTGRPKGVAITHESAMNTVIDINQKFGVNKEDNIIGLSSMCFDLSVYDIFGSLSTGATLVEIPDIHDMKYISEIIEKEDITIWNSVPAVIDMLIIHNDAQNNYVETGSEDIIEVKLWGDSLRLVLLSGDWIPVSLPDKIKEQYENAEIISLGGATEASIWSIYYPIEKVDTSWKSIPYGKPLANQEYYVLNYDLKDCPVGVAGELYIGGKGLAREYYRDEEKTKSAFINHSKYGRLYKTGDYGVMNRDGNIIFLGRKDYQVKIGGHRIELGEIENQLMKYEKVSNCTVVDWEKDRGQKYLCAYIISEDIFDEEEIRKFLSLSLPEYMVPQYYERISSIPVNINGKVDKKKLQKPEIINMKSSKIDTEKEKEIVDIWKEILHMDNIGKYDDFFRIGGDSISALKVYAELIKKYQLNVQDLYRYRNAYSLSKILKKKNPEIYFRKLKEEFKEKEHLFMNLDDNVINEYNEYLDKIKVYKQLDIRDKNEYKDIFITGGTGFLGTHILYEFLKNTNSNIHLLIRGNNKETAKKRVIENLVYFDKYNKEWDDKINIVLGDITKNQLGINDNEFIELTQKIDCIFNSAAIVSHLGLYDKMYKTNVEGCKNILEFAKKTKNAKIFHISTKNVGFGTIKNTNQVLFSENDFEKGQKIDDNYSKTKYEAEKLMNIARKEGMDVTIFRMGNISCEYETGKFQKNINESAFYILTRSFLRIGMLPISHQNTVDLTYVDKAARAIFLLSTVRNFKNETFHIENTKLISFTDFGKYLNEIGEYVELKEYDDMIDYIFTKYEDNKNYEIIREINNLITYIEYLPWHHGTIFKFAKDKTEIILNKLDFYWQKPDGTMIKKLISHGKERGFLDKK